MKEILSYCGNRCDLCPAYIENIKSEADKQAVSDGWRKYYGYSLPAEAISCVGCLNEGKHLSAACKARPCAIEKGVSSCGSCSEFGCEISEGCMRAIEVISKNMDLSKIPEEDYKKFFEPYENRARLTEIHKNRE